LSNLKEEFWKGVEKYYNYYVELWLEYIVKAFERWMEKTLCFVSKFNRR